MRDGLTLGNRSLFDGDVLGAVENHGLHGRWEVRHGVMYSYRWLRI
jgi:hypothetical protein